MAEGEEVVRGARVAGLALILALALLAPAAGGGPGGEWPRGLCVEASVAVVVFDRYLGLDAGLIAPGSPVELQASSRGPYTGPYEYCFRVWIDAYQAPRDRASLLAAELQSLYEYPAPEGPRGPQGAARLPLPEAYEVIVEHARRVVSEAGGDPDSYHDIVVFIGDLDGVARYYMWAAHYPYVPQGYLSMGPVKTWGGPRHATFYDLAAAQGEWPSYDVPYRDRAPPAGPETEPIAWSLTDPNAYARGLLLDHLDFHLVGDSHYDYPYFNITVPVIVLDFGDDRAAREAAAQAGPREAERLAEALAPWIDVNVTVTIVEAPPEVARVYQQAPEVDGYKVIDYEALHAALQPLAAQYKRDNVTWPFIVLATPQPAHLQYRAPGYTLNFTGYSTEAYGATTLPGLDERVHRGGLPAVIAHEIGHRLGEAHPFQRDGRIRWLMDLQATVMSYYDPGIAALQDYYAYSAMRIALHQAIQHLARAIQQGAPEDLTAQAAQLIQQYQGDDALRLLAQANATPPLHIPQIPPGPTHEKPRPPAATPLAPLAVALIIALAACAILRRH